MGDLTVKVILKCECVVSFLSHFSLFQSPRHLTIHTIKKITHGWHYGEGALLLWCGTTDLFGTTASDDLSVISVMKELIVMDPLCL